MIRMAFKRALRYRWSEREEGARDGETRRNIPGSCKK